MIEIPLNVRINSDDLIKALLDDARTSDFIYFIHNLIMEIRDCPDGLSLLEMIEKAIEEAKSY